jgi:obg-like ATPase 1
VALEERLALMTLEEKKEEEAKVGATGALPKITQAGYTSLDVSLLPFANECNLQHLSSSSVISLAGLMRFVHGLSEKEQKPLKPLVLFSTYILIFSVGQNSYLHLSSDFENKFVCGEIMAYDDLKEHGSESAVKAAGKLRQQGKPYESTLFRCLEKQILIIMLQSGGR